ncbi:DUF2207 domain-containing protein [Psychrobacillus sp. FSL H8-0483]|uniref:DUF2207 domain-containing protein n=1 Tax=Psychrobacillus sp. FSL H8-0483 TaxID=2921389 RepID=UPI00315A07BE
MKKFFFLIVIFLLALSPSIVAEARSYSIDTVHIKSWIQPNGDLLVNEVFTYNFEGSYTNLRRSFPEKHEGNVEDFYAYELTTLSPEPGFIEDNTLIPLNISIDNGVYRTSINKTNEKVSFMYVYTLKNAVKTYDTYSVANVTYFEDGDAHDQDYHQVTVDYILPQSMDPSKFDGVFFDRNAVENGKSEYGIRFSTPISEESSVTKTTFFFPSTVMTSMEKTKSDVSMNEAFENEKQLADAMQKKLSNIPALMQLIPTFSLALVIIAILFIIALPQRHFWRKGTGENILDIDILYLFSVYKTGKRNKKGFLAGLFSLVEKKAAIVKPSAAALRFKNDPKAPKDTLFFRLKNGGIAKGASENYLIQWLFNTRSGSSKWAFHLHDAAGAPRKESDRGMSNYYHARTKDFKKNQKTWHKKVQEELVEAETFHPKLPKLIISLTIILLSTFVAFSNYADLRSGGGIVFIALITIFFLIIYWVKWSANGYFIAYMILLSLMVGDTVNDELMSEIIGAIFATILLYIAVPKNILSMNAVRVKDNIRSFQRSMGNGIPATLTKEEQEKWTIRAYLFGRKNVHIPVADEAIPLAALLITGTDPMDYVTKSWKWSTGITSSGGSSDSGGAYSDGGGGDSGGGGAGAD